MIKKHHLNVYVGWGACLKRYLNLSKIERCVRHRVRAGRSEVWSLDATGLYTANCSQLNKKDTYLTASKGRLKLLKMRSEKASDTRNGVVECFLIDLDDSNTARVTVFPTIPATEQTTALQAATCELTSSMRGFPAIE